MNIFETIHFITLMAIVTCDMNIYSRVLKSFEESYSVHCVLLISERSIMNLNDFNLPIVTANLSNPLHDMKSISNQCKNHVFVLKNVHEINLIKPQHLHVSMMPNSGLLSTRSTSAS